MPPYTRAWTRNNPVGATAANSIDDEIRNLRQDIEERVAVIIAGWNTAAPTDPVTIQPNIIGTAQLVDASVTSAKIAVGAVPNELPKHVTQAFYDGSTAATKAILDVLVNVGLIEVS